MADAGATESVVTSATDFLIGQGGVFGIVIILLVAALVFLWLDMKAERKAHDEAIAAKDSVISGLQEKRIVEARESLSAITSNTSALSNLTQVFTLLSNRNRD